MTTKDEWRTSQSQCHADHAAVDFLELPADDGTGELSSMWGVCMAQDKIIGIDLGTTNSCVAVVEGGRPVVVSSTEGGRTTPSIVSFDQSGNRIIGDAAKRQSLKHPDTTIRSIKRHMGTDYRLTIDHREFSPEQISAMVLTKLKQQAQQYLGEKVIKAIITCPAYFDDSQRLATRHAGQIAGLDVIRIINEPTASALAYGLNKLQQEANIVIFDFGGGTFDVTILQFAEQVLQVKSTNGNNQLGGDDFDSRIIDWLFRRFKEENGFDLERNAGVFQRFKETAEKAKIELSTVNQTAIELPFLAYQAGDPIHMSTALTRQEFNKITEDLVRAAAAPIETALKDAKLAAEQIDHVVLVGGTTRIPAVQDFIRSNFHKEPAKSVNPDEAVAIGAAIQGAIITGEIESVLLLDVVPMSLGFEGPDGRFCKVVDKNTIIPVSKKHIFTTTEQNQAVIKVHVVQGESQQAKENVSLAKFDIADIQPAATGVAKFECTFEIDVDGIFFCLVKDLATNSEKSVELKRTTGFKQDEVKQMQTQENELAKAEEEWFRRVEARMHAESALSAFESTINKCTGFLGPEKAKQYSDNLETIKQKIANADTQELDRIKEQLNGAQAKLMAVASGKTTSETQKPA